MTDGIDASNQVAVFITRLYIDKVGTYSQVETGSLDNLISIMWLVSFFFHLDYSTASKFGMEDNCRLEFDYSTRRKGIKNLIPIVMEQGCKNQATWNGSYIE